MAERRDAVQSKGGEIFAIGNGNAIMAKDFVEQFGVSFPVYTDPSRETYALAGMRRTFGIGLRSLGRGVRALSKGHMQGLTKGDNWQQGGFLVVAPGGVVRFHHADTGAGDLADIDAVIASLG